MSSSSFNHPSINTTNIKVFLTSCFSDEWNYFDALNIKSTDVMAATHEQILSNPSDVADGVIKVEMSILAGIVFLVQFASNEEKYTRVYAVRLLLAPFLLKKDTKSPFCWDLVNILRF